jgi:iron complex transport system permease protein
VPHRWRAIGLLGALLLLLVAGAASIGIGSKSLPPGEIWRGLVDAAAASHSIVHGLRLPRTVLGALVGAALGVSGALMQAVTRNPLADPGVLGINAGAAAAVVTGVSFLGVGTFGGTVFYAFLGAAVASTLVYAVGGARRADPARLALAGMAVAAALGSYVSAVLLLDTGALDQVRFWTVGSLASASLSTSAWVGGAVAIGLVLALVLARPLNALALGDESAHALGVHPTLTRVLTAVTVTLLCGAATAACGPLVFVGLAAPHLVRALTGPDLRWMVPYCALLTPVLFLAADVAGRVLARPSEVQVGIVTAVLGGPVFLLVVRRRREVAV